MAVPADERVLRAKYLDWCSARIAERFLELTPDQIYELAHPALAREVMGGGESAGGRPDNGAESRAVEEDDLPAAVLHGQAADAVGAMRGDAAATDSLGYRTLVERVTEVLAERMRLPDFAEWAEAYRASPERYERELLGLWRG